MSKFLNHADIGNAKAIAIPWVFSELNSRVIPLPDMPLLGSCESAANKYYDVKNIDKWGYNFLIE